jgi:hypothetical protein
MNSSFDDYCKCWQAVYVAVMKRASKSNRPGYESLLKVYRETDLSQEKTRILGNDNIFNESTTWYF